jgi:hypothetical protein
MYEVHWARSNRADEVIALRSNARQHADHQSAEAEARTLTPPRPTLVPIVVEAH